MEAPLSGIAVNAMALSGIECLPIVVVGGVMSGKSKKFPRLETVVKCLTNVAGFRFTHFF